MTILPSHSLKRGVVAVAAAFSLMAAAPSQAAVVATFDPLFGPSIPNLGFMGTTTFDVSQGCYAAGAAAGPGYVQTGGNCVVTATSAEIDYYNYTDYAAQNPTGILTTVDLDGTYFPTDYVTDVLFNANDQVAGFDTLDSNQFQVVITQSSSNTNAPIYYNGSMLLYFTTPLAIDPAVLVDCNTNADGSEAGSQSICSRNTNANSFEASVTFQNTDPGTVPEPGTIPLALIGLGAIAAANRRSQSVSKGRRCLDT